MIIDRDNCKVTKWDKIYCELLKKIVNEGIYTSNRTGVNTYSIEGVNFKLEDIENNFPILETKKVFVKNALSEILWIHQAQSNDVNWLNKRGNKIWDEWKIDKDGVYRIYEPEGSEYIEKYVDVVDINGNKMLDLYGDDLKTESLIEGKTIKKAIYYGEEWANTIGTAYGWINNKFKRPQYVLNQLIENPTDRRMNIVLWQDEYIKTGVLPPCVWSTEWKVSEDKLHLYVHQRSADVPVGLPFNVTQYAILQRLFAKVSNLKAGNLNYSIMDAHIYENQLSAINKQLDVYNAMKYYESFIARNSDKNLKNYKDVQNVEIKSINNYINNNDLNKKDLIDCKNRLIEIKTYNFMLEKKKPKLIVNNKDDFFAYSNDVINDKKYLEENPTGNEDIKLLNYSSMPFIKMPVVQ